MDSFTRDAVVAVGMFIGVSILPMSILCGLAIWWYKPQKEEDASRAYFAEVRRSCAKLALDLRIQRMANEDKEYLVSQEVA